jgi:hypothetical protein
MSREFDEAVNQASTQAKGEDVIEAMNTNEKLSIVHFLSPPILSYEFRE